MKRLAPTKQAEALKYMLKNFGCTIAERNKPRKSSKTKVIKTAWYVGSSDIELTDSQVEKMELKGWIKPVGDGKFELDDEGRALAEMMANQKEYDFDSKVWKRVISYDDDPLHKPDLGGS